MPVRGHADACLRAIGVEPTASAVAGLYEDFLDGWLVAGEDESSVRLPRAAVRSRPLLMTDIDAAAQLAGAALDLALELTLETKGA
jgi:LPPG:FO 2-phospho-L-lactate transferase